MEAPCYNCKDRHMTCHDSCDKYKQFKGYLEDVAEAKKVFNYGRSVIIESSLRQNLCRNR